MPLRQKKKLLKVFITHKNQDLKKAVLYGGGSFNAKRRHGLHSGGLVYLANLGGSGLQSGGSWRPRVPSLPRVMFH